MYYIIIPPENNVAAARLVRLHYEYRRRTDVDGANIRVEVI